MWDPLSRLTESAVTAARGTVMASALWLLALPLVGLVTSVAAAPDSWVTKLFAVLAAVAFLNACGAFWYSLLKHPDSLRSESYGLRKMEIERGLMGDTLSGVAVVESLEPARRTTITLADSSKEAESGS